MKKLSIVAALLFAFGTITFAQDAAKPADKKAAPAKTEKKADAKKTDKKAAAKPAADKKAAPADKK